MAEHQRKPRSGDRHANKIRTWAPPEALYNEAMDTVRNGLSWTMTRYLTECLKYVVGKRKTFPPRPAWAEEKAAELPDDGPIRPDEDTTA